MKFFFSILKFMLNQLSEKTSHSLYYTPEEFTLNPKKMHGGTNYHLSITTHVGKYDQADDRPKLTMLVIDIGLLIDRGLNDNCGPILACYIGPKIAPDDRPRITARVKPMTFQIYNDINNDNEI